MIGCFIVGESGEKNFVRIRTNSQMKFPPCPTLAIPVLTDFPFPLYEVCLCHELSLHNLKVERQKMIPISYRGITLDAGYRLDLVVEGQVIVEIKAVSELLPVHEAQLLSYLKQVGGGRGLLINFNVKLLKQGLRRLVV